MKTISIACSAMMLCFPAMAGINISIEKDVSELNLSASVTDNIYLSIGADTDDWVGIGAGYQTFITPSLTLNAYYEYGLYDDWLLNEVADIDGVKTKSHKIDLSLNRYFASFSLKAGLTAERVRNGFTWLTVDDANKYSVYLGTAHYFEHAYLAGRYEHHYATDESDMLDFNQGHANEWEISVGTMKPIWHVYPYAKVSLFTPNGTYYGLENNEVTWTLGASLSF
ncbi:hypothetical protein EGH82_06375 [Vibrio ponticus]|uniref:Outer membrane protein beta-barrel domain-containing protein n=1 Tax=Vibrio ponticus TaxID=265668 RepID=A0A3N3E3E7_9VIBR|nr:hypothetical protein [Vibrio ponticus]ROV61099.1 hypothetical protein EGH82_06375 [Vibrio ponticus]